MEGDTIRLTDRAPAAILIKPIFGIGAPSISRSARRFAPHHGRSRFCVIAAPKTSLILARSRSTKYRRAPTLEQPLKKGTEFPLTLTFQKAGAIAVTVKVRIGGAMNDMGGMSGM
jgi:hypothetical protein